MSDFRRFWQKSRNRDTISTKAQRRRQSGKYSGEETRCVPADSTQRAAQNASEARQAANSSRKQQGPGNKPQSSKPPRSARHSRRRHEYRPTAARIGPAQSKPGSKPHLPFSPKPDRPLKAHGNRLARRTVSACTGSQQPIIARANEALLTQHRRNPFIQLR